jgi:hypothetical protein
VLTKKLKNQLPLMAFAGRSALRWRLRHRAGSARPFLLYSVFLFWHLTLLNQLVCVLSSMLREDHLPVSNPGLKSLWGHALFLTSRGWAAQPPVVSVPMNCCPEPPPHIPWQAAFRVDYQPRHELAGVGALDAALVRS